MCANLIEDVREAVRPRFARRWTGALAILCLWSLPAGAQDSGEQEPPPADTAEPGPDADPSPAPAEPKPSTPTRRKPSRVRATGQDSATQPATKAGAARRPSPRKNAPKPARPEPVKPEPRPDTPPDPNTVDPNLDPTAVEGPAGPTEEVATDVDAEVEQLLKPAEERTYSFGIQDGTYGDLVRAFSRMSGLGVLGQAPEDTLTYVSTEKMDYETALSRVRELLFKHPENYYIWRKGNSLELVRMTEAPRFMPLDRIYTSVEAFRAASLDKMELVMVVYTPEGDPGALDQLRDFMPDYARIAPYPDKNAITIFALVGDVTKYLQLVGIFRDIEDDPRKLKILEVKYVTPSRAVEFLMQVMPSFTQRGGPAVQPAPQPARPGRKGQPAPQPEPSLQGMQSQGIELVPIDEQEKLFVRALPDKIAEVEEYLAYIDVEHADEFPPVEIPLKHVRVEQMMTLIGPMLSGGGPAPAAPAQPEGQPAVKRPRRAPRVATGGSVVTDAIGLHPNAANNSLIVIGDDEQVATVKSFVKLLDIPDETKTARVPLAHTDAATIVQPVIDIMSNLMPGAPRPLLVTPDPASNGLFIVGTKQQVELAEQVVADIDVAPRDGQPTMHMYKCKHAQPSFMVGLLNTFENESAAVPAQVTPQPAPTNPEGQPQPKKQAVRPRRQPRKTGTGAGKFHANDESSTLIVICNQKEWTDDYKPLIELIDNEAKAPEGITVIPVEKADIDKLIETVRRAVFEDAAVPGAAGPTLLPRPEGIMVVGGTDEELAKIRALVVALDTDERDSMPRRTFTLKNANPSDVKAILETLLGSGTAPAPRRPNRPQAPNQPPQAAAAVSGASGDVLIVESGRRDLIVTAPSRRMPEIEQLIKELDVDPVSAETRVYDFPPGSNVQEIAGSLTMLYPGSSTASPAPGGPRQNMPKGAGGDSEVRFIPQPAARKIVVAAPADMFEDIERNIKLLGSPVQPAESVVEFYDVQHLDAATMADLLQPVLETKYLDLVAKGTIPEPSASTGPTGRPGVQTKAQVTVTPDPQGHRVFVVAPAPLQEEVQPLIARLDRTSDDDTVMRTITLEQADPDEMVTAINAMLGGRSSAPRSDRPSRGARGGAATRPVGVVATAESKDVTVVAAPGGSAVVVKGLLEAVDEVEGWVQELDSASTPGKEIKIYRPKVADVETVADAIMTFLDSAGAIQPPKGKTDDELDSLEPSKSRVGKDITLMADYWAGTLVVSAAPAKLKEIDALYERYEGKPGEVPEIGSPVGLPLHMYDLKYVEDAYDAAYDLEQIIDVAWPDPKNKPKVDHIPWSKILTIMCKPDEYKQVEDLIVKYVDKETKKKGGRQLKPIPVKGISAANLAYLIQEQLGDKVKLVDVPRPGEAEEDSLLEQVKPKLPEVHPCVLPASAFESLALALPAQTEPKTAPATTTKKFDDEVQAKEAALQSLLEESKTAPALQLGEESPVTPAAAPAEGDAPEEVLRIRVDTERNILIPEGSRQDLEDIEDLIEEIIDKLKDIPQPPDIRVFRLKHIDVSTAAQMLEQVFNAPRQAGMTPQQMQALQRQMAQQQGRQQGGRGQQVPQQAPVPAEEEKGKDSGRGRREGARGGDEEEPQAVAEAAQQEEGQIRVVPDGRTRTIIIRAATEQFPSVIKLLATIDQPGAIAEFRIYQLKKLNAGEVELTLKGMLGLDQAGGVARRQANPQVARMQNQANQMGIPLVLDLPGMEGESVGLDSSSQIKISSSPDTNTILAMAPEKTLDLVGKLIEQLEDQQAPLYRTEFFELKHADAEEVVTQLETLFGKSPRQGRSSPAGGEGAARSTGGGFNPMDVNNPVFVAETRTNRVMVRALELDLPKIGPMITQLDVDAGVQRGAVVSVTVDSGDAVSIAATLQKVYEPPAKSGKPTSAAKLVRITGDQSSNTVFVDAPPAARDEILAKITEMDSNDSDIQTITLKFGKPTAIAQKLQEAFGGRGGKNSKIKVIGDDASMQLLVTARADTFTDIQEMVAKIDVPRTGLDIKLFPLKHARAPDILQKMTELVRSLMAITGKDGANLGTFSAVAEERSNTLVVVGEPTTFTLVEGVLAELDKETPASAEIKTMVYPLVKTQAQEVADNITRLFQNRKDVQEPPRAQANTSSNTVMVMGTQAQLDEVYEQVIKKLEEHADGFEKQVRTFKLTYADAAALSEPVKQLFKPMGRQPSPRDQVDAYPDGGSNSLVVSASPENMAKIEELIKQFDQQGAGERGVHVIDVQNADAAAVARSLSEIFVNRARNTRGQETISISNPQGSSSLMVRANEKELADIKTVVAELETASPGATSGEIKVVPLKFTDATETQAILQDFLRKPGQGGNRGQAADLAGDVRISVSADTNSLVVSGDAEQLAKLDGIIAKLDVEPTAESSNTPKIIKLNHALASAIQPSLEELFTEQARRQGGRGSTAPPPVIVADDGTNSLIVRASRVDFNAIESLITSLDQDGVSPRGGVKIIQVASGVNVSDLAAMVEESLNSSLDQKQSGRKTGPKEKLTVSADMRTNSLILAGAPSVYGEAEQMVKALERMGPTGGKKTIILRPKNMNVDDIKAVMEQMIQDNGGSTGSQRSTTPRRTPSGSRGSRPR